MQAYIERLQQLNLKAVEGGSHNFQHQQALLAEILKKSQPTRVLEIGFNTGFGSALFLSHGCNVTSFDIGKHDYVARCKEIVDDVFPGRHELVLGDSALTIPQYATDDPFDLVFIDGKHSYRGCMVDLLNCIDHSKPNALVVVDDVFVMSDDPCYLAIQSLETARHLRQVGFHKYHGDRGLMLCRYTVEKSDWWGCWEAPQ